MFTEESYRKHQSHYDQLDPDAYFDLVMSFASPQKGKENIGSYCLQQLNDCLLPFIEADSSKRWLTVGDGKFGSDAHFILKQGAYAHASDISDTLLKIAQQKGVIRDFSAENAESLGFEDNSFDYVYCKEAFHHFPRPFIGLYEMLRVAKEAVILIEPIDPMVAMPLLIGAVHLAEKFNRVFGTNIHFYRKYSFEVVGNYVYKVSEREFNKAAMGIGLRYTAFKNLQYPFELPTSIHAQSIHSPIFRKIKRKMAFHKFLNRLTLIPTNVLATVIFKNHQPETRLLNSLKEIGFKIELLPKNPYSG